MAEYQRRAAAAATTAQNGYSHNGAPSSSNIPTSKNPLHIKLAEMLRECAVYVERDEFHPVLYEALGHLHAYAGERAGSSPTSGPGPGGVDGGGVGGGVGGESAGTANGAFDRSRSSSPPHTDSSAGSDNRQRQQQQQQQHRPQVFDDVPEEAYGGSNESAPQTGRDKENNQEWFHSVGKKFTKMGVYTSLNENENENNPGGGEDQSEGNGEWQDERFRGPASESAGTPSEAAEEGATGSASYAASPLERNSSTSNLDQESNKNPSETAKSGEGSSSTVASSKPSFQRPINPNSNLIANGWIEQQRRSKMRSVWKDILASLVEGRRPGEETTLWIQRQVTNPATGRAELEALHQIPMKWLEDVQYLDFYGDFRFSLKVYNVSDEFQFRTADEASAQNWVTTLTAARDSSQGRGSDTGADSAPGLSSAGSADSGLSADPDKPSRKTIKELRAIAHGAGYDTRGMERADLERIAAQQTGGPVGSGGPSQAQQQQWQQSQQSQPQPAPTPTAQQQHHHPAPPGKSAEEQQREMAEEWARAEAARKAELQRKVQEEAQQQALADEARRADEAARAEVVKRSREEAERRKREKEMAAAIEEKRKQEAAARAAEEERRRQAARAAALEEERRLQEAAAKAAAEAERKRLEEEHRRRMAEQQKQQAAEAERKRQEEAKAEEERKRQQWQQWQQQQQQQQQWQQQQQQRAQWQQQQQQQQRTQQPQQHFQNTAGRPPPPPPPQQRQQYQQQQQQQQQQHQRPPQPPQGAPTSPVNTKYAKMSEQKDEADSQAAITRVKREILIKWALLPPSLQMLRPIDQLVTTIHNVFPPAFGTSNHAYFAKWKPIAPTDVTFGNNAMGNGVDDEKLKKAVRKIRFFLHPDKRPKDLDVEQEFMCKMLWDVTSDAWEEYCKQKEELDWIR